VTEELVSHPVLGVSYVTVSQMFVEPFAPVVERLAGR
jgi:hypothetical protein